MVAIQLACNITAAVTFAVYLMKRLITFVAVVSFMFFEKNTCCVFNQPVVTCSVSNT